MPRYRLPGMREARTRRAQQAAVILEMAPPQPAVKTVRIYGVSDNVGGAPLAPADVEVWCFNNPRSIRIQRRAAMQEWTRWFNMHTRHHQLHCYKRGYEWYTQQTKPIYLQEVDPAIPSSVRFPREAMQDFFKIGDKPFRYFTSSGNWLIALALYEGFQRIEVWGHAMKPKGEHQWQRPGFFYWIERARAMGADVFIPPGAPGGVGGDPSIPGDPLTYTGPLYGYEPHSNAYRETFGPLV